MISLRDVKFELSNSFLKPYKSKKHNMTDMGYIVFKRTYARNKNVVNEYNETIYDREIPNNEHIYFAYHDKLILLYEKNNTEYKETESITLDELNIRYPSNIDDKIILTGVTEEWWETVRRVVEGCFQIQKWYCNLPQNRYEWKERKAKMKAEKMFDKIFNCKILPAGRGLWMMGTEFIRLHNNSMCLNNCGFVTTKDIKTSGSSFAKWMMDALMLGVGIGFDVFGGISLPKTSDVILYADAEEIAKIKVKNMSFDDICHELEECNTELKQRLTEEIVMDPKIKENLSDTEYHEIHTRELYIKYYANELVKADRLKEEELQEQSINERMKLPENKDQFMIIKKPVELTETYVIPDTRQGWVISVGIIFSNFFYSHDELTEIYDDQQNNTSCQEPEFYGLPKFDYSQIRPRGEPIRGFGGIASGPEPLMELHKTLIAILSERINKPLRSVDIIDCLTNICKCVVSGNVRRCLADSQRVMTNRGEIQIKNVMLTDKVLTHDGTYKNVKNIFQQGKQECVRIKTPMGSLICTPNHRVAVYDSLSSYIWKKASNLTKKDRLLSIAHLEGKSDITPEMAWLIGFYLGNGHSDFQRLKNNGHGGGSVIFATSIDKYNQGLKNKFIQTITPLKYSIHTSIQKKGIHISIYNRHFSEKLYKYKAPNSMPQIPQEVWEGNAQIRGSFLAGICDSDGGVRNTLVWSKYPEFCEQIQQLALSLGIASTYHNQETKIVKGKKYDGCNSVTLRGLLAQRNAKKYIEPYSAVWKVEIKSEKKNGLSLPFELILQAKCNGIIAFEPLSSGLIRPTNKGHEIVDMGNGLVQQIKYRDANFDTLIEKHLVSDQWLPIEILCVENVGEHETYDLEIESDHEFVCENFLVHNSASISLGKTNDYGFIHAKDPELIHYNTLNKPYRDARWASNNSVMCEIGDDYTEIAEMIAKNGEPGIVWMDNIRSYSRMRPDEKDYKDIDAVGCNPCFHPDTLIAVADGRNAISIKQLAEEGKDIPVYSVNAEGMVEIKMGRNPRLTQHDQKLLKITLDDQSTLIVTPNHKMRLLNGYEIEAKNLQEGDSLPRFSKYKVKVKPTDRCEYYRVRTNTHDMAKNQYVEHRLVAQFFHPELWKERYVEDEQHGFVQGNLVVHHKDENGLNNNIDNLEILTFNEHNIEHDKYNNHGENNPMFGKTHSEATKQLIGQRTSERCSDEEYKKMLAKSIAEGMDNEETRQKISQSRLRTIIEQEKEFEKTTDLETTWIDGRLYVVKICEHCHEKFLVIKSKRDRSYCSMKCSQTHLITNEKRIENHKQYYEDKQQDTLHQQIMIYKNLKKQLHDIPLKKEWEEACQLQNVSFRCNPKSDNPYVLRSYKDLQERSKHYNHRVEKIEMLREKSDVYNITVDANHTIGIITQYDKSEYGGVFTPQCSEQSLSNKELCNLGEVFPSKLESYEEFRECLELIYLYTKSITLLNTDWCETNSIMGKNRRIGISMSGILDAMTKHGKKTIIEWFEKGYDELRAMDADKCTFLCVPQSIKLSSVKPSGTISLLANVSPGIHAPHSKYYIRRIRMDADSPIVKECERCGYNVYNDPFSKMEYVDEKGVKQFKYHTKIVDFPCQTEYFTRGKTEYSMFEQLINASEMQRCWSDNQVSCTVTFNKDEAKQLKYALEYAQFHLKGISFLPLTDHGYIYPPYETITETQYNEMCAKLTDRVNLDLKPVAQGVGERFCSNDTCELK